MPDARSPLSYARRYAQLGWHILPLWWAHDVDGEWRCACGNAACRTPAKHPITVPSMAFKGQDSSTTDESLIASWWNKFPAANIGVVLAPSNLVAIDIDPRNGGIATIADVEARHGSLESDVLQFTGGGGEHRIFAIPAGQALSLPGKLGPGVDVKHNGYVVLEPSRHVSGQGYAFEASSDPLEGAVASPLPDWIRDLARQAPPPIGDTATAGRRPMSAQEITDLRAALSMVPGSDRDAWLAAGMALHNDVGGQLGYDLWAQWSQTADPSKFDPVDQMRVWRSFRRRPMGQAVQLPTIYSMAYRNGFVAPAAVTMMIEPDPEPAPQPVPPNTDTPADLLTIPGMLGQAVQWINDTARKNQPLLAVQAALALGSVLMGRRYRTDNGNWPMMYFLNVADSGAGKEHAKYAVETILESAGLAALIGPGRFASESSVLSALVEKPSQFSVLDEFGKMLQSAAVAQNYADRNTLKALMEVWGRADGVMRAVAYSTAGLSSRQAEDLAKRQVRNPSLSILAMSTGETLFAGLTSAAVADGFLSRLLTVHADRGRQMAQPVDQAPPPARLIEWAQNAHAGVERTGNLASISAPHDMDPTPIAMAFEPAALAQFEALERRTHQRMDDLEFEGLAEMLNRVTEMAMRLSMIVAGSCNSLDISGYHAAWACQYVEHHSNRNIQMLRERLSEGPFDQLCKEICRLVLRAGAQGMTERDLDKSSRPWRASPERMRLDALSSLVRREEIVRADIVSMSGRGRKRQAYADPSIVNNADKRRQNADRSVGN